MHWGFWGSLSRYGSPIILAIPISFGALSLHERVCDLINTSHQAVANEPFKPFSSVWIAEVHYDICSINVFLRHILTSFYSMRLWFNRFEYLNHSIKHFFAHLLLDHLVERAIAHFVILKLLWQANIFDESLFQAAEDSPPLLDATICKSKQFFRN